VPEAFAGGPGSALGTRAGEAAGRAVLDETVTVGLDHQTAAAVPDQDATIGPDEIPVPHWDELSLGSIRARLRRLSEEDVVVLHRYEEQHAARQPVLSMLGNRLVKIRADAETRSGISPSS
jgi:hypothetical protein